MVSAVQSALPVVGRLPPPSSGADVLAGLHGAGAWLAAYAGETFVVQLVVGHMVFADIVPDVFFRPVDERIHLQLMMHLVPLHSLHVLAGDTLAAAQSAHPYVQR